MFGGKRFGLTSSPASSFVLRSVVEAAGTGGGADDHVPRGDERGKKMGGLSR